ncbi:dromyosuppressin isoform X2 [Eurosta solidaginis]
MSSQMVAIFCFAIILIATMHTANAMGVPPFCQTGMVEDMPTHIQKVCSALSNSEQLATALKSYLNSEAAAMLTDQAPLKRSDVDHVFLRFGKRR